MIKKAILVAAVALLLSGCAAGSYESTDNGSQTYDRGSGVSVLTVLIPDGRTVYCVDSGRGLDCDWDSAQ